MEKNMECMAFLACMILIVSVLSAGIVLSDRGADTDVAILVYQRGTEIQIPRSIDYSLVEEYDGYVLIETSIENIDVLKNNGFMLEVLDDRDYVGLQAYSFNTEDGLPDIPENLEISGYPRDGRGYYIVQFIGPIRTEWQEELQDRGVTFHEFRHKFNFIVEMNLRTMREVEQLEFVNWVGIYQPAYRFNPELLETNEPIVLEISVFDSADSRIVANRLSNIGAEIHRIARNHITIETEPGTITTIANFHNVKAIVEGHLEDSIFNSDATWITQTNEQNNRKVLDMGVTGEGELITVMDSELYGGNSDNPDHECWADPDGNPVGDDHRKIQAHYVPADAGGDLNNGVYHGTHVTGTVLGDSPPYGTYNNEDGNAMAARVIFQDVSSDACGSVNPPSDMYNDGYGQPYDWGSRAHTNSWGGGSGYGASAITSDEFIWDHKDFNILYAMGNDGSGANTISSQSEGKNVLSIGAVTNSPNHEDVASFSSRGYADDGRIKPTVMHIGENLVSADRSTDGYSSMSGTSMSTPGVAGQVGQVRHYYEGGWYPSGTQSAADGFNPSNALVRATLINGAVEISGSGAYQNDNRFPNGDQGYGRSMLDRVMHFEGDERKLIVFDSWHEGVELNTGETWSMDFEVEDASQELEVTLAWSDYPGSSGADGSNPAIVNDLDLELDTPGGTRYVGNAFTGYNPGYSEPNPTSNPWNGQRSGEFDGLNVEENILLLPDQNGVEEGIYTITVSGYQIPQSSQPFAIVVSGGVTPPEAVDPPQITLTRPTGGETWNAEDMEDIQWTTTAGDGTITGIDLEYTTNDGTTWNTIITGTSDTGSYSWQVPDVLTDEARIRATVHDDNVRSDTDVSDLFTIEGTVPPDIALTTPSGGEMWSAESWEDIEWSTTVGDGTITGIDLEYSTDDGATWSVIVSGTSDTGSYSWQVPDEATDEARIRATVHDDNDLSETDVSDVFTILGTPPEPPVNLVVEHVGTIEGSALEENFEGGSLPDGWTIDRTGDDTANQWGVVTETHQNSDTPPDGDYMAGIEYSAQGVDANEWLISTSVEIPDGVEATLTFQDSYEWTDYVTDSNYVKISTTDQETGSFTDTVATYTQADIEGQGDNVWDTKTIDLSAYAGETIYIAWEYIGDWAENWYIDDVQVNYFGDGDGDEHNLLTWEASPDEPDIVEYTVYRAEEQGGAYELIDSVEADGSGTYQYLDSNKGMADEIFWWYMVHAVDEQDQECVGVGPVQEPGAETDTMEIPLSADIGSDRWNFVSFNLELSDTNLVDILEDPEHGISGNYDNVMYFDATSDRWYSYVPDRSEHFNNLGNWDHTMGIWIRMTDDDTLTVEGSEPGMTTMTLEPGWNMVGLPSSTAGNHNLPAEVTTVGHFDPAQAYNIAYVDAAGFEFSPGQGYWVYNDADQPVDWTVEF